VTYPPPPIADGAHTFDVRAVNAEGPSEPASLAWTIDTNAPPEPSITAKPPDPSNDSSPTFRFSDSEPGVTFQCRLESQAFDDCTSPKSYAGLTSGSHTFRVRAIDAAGNQRSNPARYDWRIDLTPPPAPAISSSPANPTTATDATFAFTDSEAGVTFRCAFDGGSFSSCTSPAAYSGLSITAHVFSVGAVDAAGNAGAPTSFGWTIVAAPDTTAPANISGLRRSIGYGTFKLAWRLPPDADFDHVRILIATTRKGPKALPRKVVYTGRGTRYTNKRFKNEVYHRYRILSYDHRGNRSGGVEVVVPPSALLRLPKAGAVMHAPPRLVWTAVARAMFYNVQLYLGGRKILSAWPTGPRLGLKKRWFYSGRSFRLRKGAYSWYVWPGFGPRLKGRYGQLLGVSTFTVR
jgi:hypothetical protein